MQPEVRMASPCSSSSMMAKHWPFVLQRITTHYKDLFLQTNNTDVSTAHFQTHQHFDFFLSSVDETVLRSSRSNWRHQQLLPWVERSCCLMTSPPGPFYSLPSSRTGMCCSWRLQDSVQNSSNWGNGRRLLARWLSPRRAAEPLASLQSPAGRGLGSDLQLDRDKEQLRTVLSSVQVFSILPKLDV